MFSISMWTELSYEEQFKSFEPGYFPLYFLVENVIGFLLVFFENLISSAYLLCEIQCIEKKDGWTLRLILQL